MMRHYAGRIAPATALALVLSGLAAPARADDTDARLRRLEAEVRALKKEVAPNGDRTIAPQAEPQSVTVVPGAPATTPVSDLLTRVDALEGQLARLTAQNEEAGNRIRQLEARVTTAETTLHPPAAPADGGAPPAPDAPAPASDNTAAGANLGAMARGDASLRPVASTKVGAARSSPSAGPSAQRLAAVRAIVKPQTRDPGDDDYSYAYHLWEAKFYPEAEQQLKLFLEKYPRHKRTSYARNLMGRTLLDEGNPHDAASWFVENYNADKRGARAPDSLLLLAEAMRLRGDKNRACIALTQFASDYPAEAAGRLKGQYDETRGAVKCN